MITGSKSELLTIDTFVLDGMASYGMHSTDTSRADVTRLANGFSTKGVKGNDALLSIGFQSDQPDE